MKYHYIINLLENLKNQSVPIFEVMGTLIYYCSEIKFLQPLLCRVSLPSKFEVIHTIDIFQFTI